MKKHNQLGMNYSTASGRLVKDLLFKFAIHAGEKCHQCGGGLQRGDFSIEHKTPWLDSADPIAMFFDLDNIAFSHLGCNAGAARRRTPSEHGTNRKFGLGCRCELCVKAKADTRKKYYAPEQRREKYIKTGN